MEKSESTDLIIKSGVEYVELLDYTFTGTNETISIVLMHAGDSSMPVAIYIKGS
ncbi:hypothetical protein [Gracilibacillus boraciitolerans]|uniref:hypothetical protein n=1 Tax=Gracilibacillus boraciitolerans TaxID=307521 RepID=UPI0004B4B6D3|nr:hypothetical protein [Gracilibacillus boraciitolerans]